MSADLSLSKQAADSSGLSLDNQRMTRRYFAPDLLEQHGTLALSDDEARHAARVMRLQPGDSLELFDGAGNQADAIVLHIDKRSCTVQFEPATEVNREPHVHSHLLIALPKPERAKEMAERLCELGVGEITPVSCQRTQRPPTQHLLEKLRRTMIESCKQSTHNVVPVLNDCVEFARAVDLVKEQRPLVAWIAHPGGQDLLEIDLAATQSSAADSVNGREQALALIGPEGGFTDEETQLACQTGWTKVGLGQRIYRVETAAVVIQTVLSR